MNEQERFDKYDKAVDEVLRKISQEGKTVKQACEEANISQATYHRRRRGRLSATQTPSPSITTTAPKSTIQTYPINTDSSATNFENASKLVDLLTKGPLEENLQKFKVADKLYHLCEDLVVLSGIISDRDLTEMDLIDHLELISAIRIRYENFFQIRTVVAQRRLGLEKLEPHLQSLNPKTLPGGVKAIDYLYDERNEDQEEKPLTVQKSVPQALTTPEKDEKTLKATVTYTFEGDAELVKELLFSLQGTK